MKTWPEILFLAILASLIGTVSRAEDPKPCDDGDCTECRTRGLVAGVEATYLRPSLSGGNMLFENAEGEISTHDLSKTFFQGAPRIWLGIENDCGWGVRTRYWDFHEDAHGDDTTFDFPTQADFTSGITDVDIRAYTIDLELTRRFTLDDVDVLAGFGVRHALRSVDETLAVTYQPDFTSTFASLWDRAEGTGLTAVIEGHRKIGCSRFSAFGNLRGSVLWGNHRNGFWNNLSTQVEGVPVQAIQALDITDTATQYIVEAQFGICWSQRVECIKGDVFSHLAFEYQRWTTSDIANFHAAQSINDTAVSVRSLGDQMEFTGLSWSIGFTR